MMNRGALITFAVAAVAIGGVLMAFMSNASPYVTVAQAREMKSDRLHLAGDMIKDSVRNDFRNRTVRFQLKDEKGDVVEVVHRGDPPANMGDATKVVAIGGMKDGVFESNKLLIKCPSKYEEEKSQPKAG